MNPDPKILHLTKARKLRDLAADKAQADANALRFGRTKAERLREAALNAQAKARLDQTRFEE